MKECTKVLLRPSRCGHSDIMYMQSEGPPLVRRKECSIHLGQYVARVDVGVTPTCTASLCVGALEQDHPTLPADGPSFRFQDLDQGAPTWM
jgi:hypothetical protein